jgi:L-fuconolactonase
MSTLPPIPVIDTHLHVWDVNAPWMAWLNDRPETWQPTRRDFTWRELRTELDDARVANLILVQAGMTPIETRQLLRLAAEQPSVRGVVGWASLTSARATARDLDSFAGPGADKLVGIRNNHGWAPDHEVLADPGVIHSLRVIAERGLTLDLHFRDHTELPLAVTLAERLPELTYVIDHLGKPSLGDNDALPAWAASMDRLSRLPNVYVKYSGWATFIHRTLASDVRPYIDLVLDLFGSDRVMYGGNWPVALVSGSYRRTYQATVDAIANRPRPQLEDVLHRTAERCYLRTVATSERQGRHGVRTS